MEALNIEKTEFTPQVILDGTVLKFEISGESRPENTGKFYDPIIKWLEQYESVLFWQKNNFGKQNRMMFDFRLEYFNSTSAKYIMDILVILDKFFTGGYDIVVTWHFDNLDTDMKEAGEEFARLVNVPFEFKTIEG